MRRFIFLVLAPGFALLAAAGCGGAADQSSGSGGSGTGGQSSATGGQGSSTGGQGSSTGGQGSSTGGQPATSACGLPQATGPCLAASLVFWHNPATHVCEPFLYGGCGGNDNRFPTLAACLATCGPTAKPAEDACDRASDCVAISPGCCAACEPVEISDRIAVNTARAAERACDVACGACPPLPAGASTTGRYFDAECVDHRCVVVDIRETRVTECSIDSDCQVRIGAECCERCNGEPVAVNRNANLCPDGPAGCPPCAPIIPPGYGSVCSAGHCLLTEPPCGDSPCPEGP